MPHCFADQSVQLDFQNMNCGKICEKKLCGNVCEKQKSARATQWRETSGKRLRGAIPQMEPVLCRTTQQRSQRDPTLHCNASQVDKDLSTIPEIEINQRPQCPTIPHHSS